MGIKLSGLQVEGKSFDFSLGIDKEQLCITSLSNRMWPVFAINVNNLLIKSVMHILTLG